MNVRVASFGEICEFKYGKSLAANNRNLGPVVVYGSNGPVGVHDISLSEGPAIIIGRKGSVGEVHYCEGPNWAIDTTYFIDQTSTDCDLKWLSYALKFSRIRELNKAAAVPGLNRNDAYRETVVVPPLDEQKRIAAILDKADQLRQKRRQATALLDSLTGSIFLEMFGDPVSNPKGLERVNLANVARFTSGATPSKSVPEFWEGSIPWVSPKDMKVNEIYDAQDHVSVSALEQTNLKSIEPDTTLIVVRGMILAHTVPLAVTKVPTTINQDMKAIVFSPNVQPMVGFWNLKVQAAHILSQISTAAHGTKKLDMEILEKLPVLVPAADKQNAFVTASATIKDTIQHSISSSRNLELNFSSLQHRAFSGQL